MVGIALASLATVGAVVIGGGLLRFVRALFTYKREIESALRWGK